MTRTLASAAASVGSVTLPGGVPLCISVKFIMIAAGMSVRSDKIRVTENVFRSLRMFQGNTSRKGVPRNTKPSIRRGNDSRKRTSGRFRHDCAR